MLFEVEMQSEREDPMNRLMMYGEYGNNSYHNVNATPLQGQPYMEMLNNPSTIFNLFWIWIYEWMNVQMFSGMLDECVQARKFVIWNM